MSKDTGRRRDLRIAQYVMLRYGLRFLDAWDIVNILINQGLTLCWHTMFKHCLQIKGTEVNTNRSNYDKHNSRNDVCNKIES